MKNHWMTPQLIVLGRGEPQEAVLVICKDCNCAGSSGATGEGGSNTGCYRSCQDCQGMSHS